MITISQIMEKMIAFSKGNLHDINPLSAYGRMRGLLENWNVWMLIRSIFLKLQPLSMTLPVHCAVKNMAIPTGNIRRLRE